MYLNGRLKKRRGRVAGEGATAAARLRGRPEAAITITIKLYVPWHWQNTIELNDRCCPILQ